MVFTPHSLHKHQIQIQTSNLRVLRSARYTQRHTARFVYVKQLSLTAAMDGSSFASGEGWVTSAPMIITGFSKHFGLHKKKS
jgi:hypothetical protein